MTVPVEVSHEQATRLNKHMHTSKLRGKKPDSTISRSRRRKAIWRYRNGRSKKSICRDLKMGLRTLDRILREGGLIL